MLLSFRIKTNPKERENCFKEIAQLPDVTIRNFKEEDRKDSKFVKAYFNEVARHKFVICPWGNGIDCHRFWETWYLGSIPIIKYHPALKDFYDLPALWIDNWKDLHKIDLEKEFNRIYKAKWNFDKLNFDFWHNKILNIIKNEK